MFELGNAEENLLINKGEKNKYTNDNINISLENKNDSHSLIVQNIKENSTCLDIGCAGGYVGEFLKNIKNCTVDGIEIDKEAFLIAKNKKIYDNLYNFSITNLEDENYKKFFSDKTKYDYILFADVLEHLVDPDLIICRFFKKLKCNGKIIISLPNIAHMDISKNLIDRDFNYNTKGLLDNTHLRFFTKNSFLQMISSINDKYKMNIKAKIIGKTVVEPIYANIYPNLFNIQNEDSELCVLQYIIELSKSKEKVEYKFRKNSYYKKIEEELNKKNILLKQRDEYLKEIEKNNTEINKLLREINVYKTKINELTEEISTYKKKINKMEENQKVLENENNDIKYKYENILNSNSWKITEPLRTLRKIIQNIKNRF